MKSLSEKKQKFYIVLVAALVSLIGLEAASEIIDAYQVKVFLYVSLYVYIFLVFWQSFIFDLHLNQGWKSLRDRFGYLLDVKHGLHYQNYLVLPAVIYWATISILFLNPFDLVFKQVIIVLGTLGLTISFWYLKTVFYKHKEANHNTRQAIFLTKLLAAYFAYTASFGLSRYLGLSSMYFTLFVSGITFILLYQAFWQHHFINGKTIGIIVFYSLILGVLGLWIFKIWNANYFSGALVLAAVYNTLWGFVHHKLIDKNLTKTMVYEYLAVLLVVLIIIFNTTNFAERVL